MISNMWVSYEEAALYSHLQVAMGKAVGSECYGGSVLYRENTDLS